MMSAFTTVPFPHLRFRSFMITNLDRVSIS
jgi:hypothetical protein